MLELRDIRKTFEGQPLLNGVSFQVSPGETLCLLGPSGSGKSTLLRIIAGLEPSDAGQVLWDGQDLAQTPTHRRGFGLMFQDYALFPHRNVAQNVAFGLRMQGLPGTEIDQRVAEALERVNLLDFSRRKVTDLSGGEQQRVALARALAPRPRLLMLDEPLGALDRSLREQLGEELRRILHATHIPAIYVTHDQEEAYTIADRLALLHNGLIAQQGAPAEIYASPASPWVASFFGLGSLLAGEVVKQAPCLVSTAVGALQVTCSHPRHPLGEKVVVLVRPTPVEVCLATDGRKEANLVTGVVEDAVFTGREFRVGLRATDGTPLYFYLPTYIPPGQHLLLEIKPAALLCLGSQPED